MDRETIVIALVFLVLLGLDWRYRRRSMRLGTVAFALIVWMFSQPNVTIAGWQVTRMAHKSDSTPSAEPLSEYFRGATAMREAVLEQDDASSDRRLLAVTVLSWLACSTSFRQARADSQTPTKRGWSHTGAG